MKTIDLLKEFTGEIRWTTDVWSIGSRAFATNGHLLISVPLKFVDEDLPTFDKFNPLAIFDLPRLETPIEFQAKELLSSVSVADEKELSEIAKCFNCGGSGECRECSCDALHQCGKCEGSGIGNSFEKYAGLCGKLFDFKYLKMIFRTAEMFNGGVFSVVAVSEDEKQPVLFELGMIQIALMPCKRVAEERIIQLSKNEMAL